MFGFKARSHVASTKKALPYPLWAELLRFAILLTLNQLLKSLCAGLWCAAVPEHLSSPAVTVLLGLYATVPATALTLLLCLIFHPPVCGALPRAGAVRCYAWGLGHGILLLVGAIGIGVLTGSLRLLPERMTEPLQWGAFLLGFLLQSFGEELLFRGYLLRALLGKCPAWAAICMSSTAFAALHLRNPGMRVLAFVNLFLFGVLAALYTMRQANIWGISAVHAAWNFAQGNLFGLPVSGSTVGPAPLRAVPADGKSLWNGGAFGLEGGLCTTVVLLAGIAVCLLHTHWQGRSGKQPS